MKGTLLRCVALGDMEVHYRLSDEGIVSMRIDPAGKRSQPVEKRENADSLVQIRLRGDDFPFGFANGLTMRNSSSVRDFLYEKQDVLSDGETTKIVTRLASKNGLAIEHTLTYYSGGTGVESRTAFINNSEASVTIEMLSSFSLSGLTPYEAGDACGSMVLHRLRSKWSNEGRLCSDTIEDLQLEPTWSGHGAFSEKFGTVGSMPVRHYFPFAAVEDRKNGVIWGVQLCAPISWQIEAYRRDDGLCLSGGQADFDFGHWAKNVAPGESFETMPAYLSVCEDGLDVLCSRLTNMQKRALNQLERPERLPVVFNEFCATWGNPSRQRVEAMLKALKGKDIDCFVIDSGWYAEEGKSWEMNMGDWRVNRTLFPNGMKAVADSIRAAGMTPGLWFEPETCGCDADAFTEEKHQLKRFGTPIRSGLRRFWDMRDPWVRQLLREKMIDLLAESGFGYVKIDFNESFGVGCDGAESLGEGLRQDVEATKAFFKEIHERVPGILIENCSSGGHRNEPSFLGICQLASATDSHEERELPIIAANLHRTMLPEQSLIWAVLRKEDTLKRVVWSIAATFLGVMCLSGDIETLSAEQWAIIDRGIAFYRKAERVIREGVSLRRGPEIASYRHPAGWQAVERTAPDGGEKLVVVHTYDGAPAQLCLDVGEDYETDCVFAESRNAVQLIDGKLMITIGENAACAVLLRK